MKKSILLVLVYCCMQIGVTAIVKLMVIILGLATPTYELPGQMLAPTLVLSMICMLIFLYYKEDLPTDRKSWSFVSIPYLLLTLVISVSSIPLMDGVSSIFRWMPDLTKNAFDVMSSGIIGIIALTVLGPIFEEVLFRGIITKLLFQSYKPVQAILLSALIFGVFHLNPAQIIPAFLAGLILASLYYHSGSLIPGIILHICVNGSSALSLLYLDNGDTSIYEMVSTETYIIIMLCAASCFVASCLILPHVLNKTKGAINKKAPSRHT